jgi:hypothetical protein
MNEQSAREQGLNFTGIYSSNTQEVKDQIAKIKEEYPLCRIRLVNVPHSKLSRSGPGMGYSAHADIVYSAYKGVEEAKKQIDTHHDRLGLLKAEYDKKVADENKMYQINLERKANAESVITKAQESKHNRNMESNDDN